VLDRIRRHPTGNRRSLFRRSRRRGGPPAPGHRLLRGADPGQHEL